MLLFAIAWNLAEAREVRSVELRSGATGTRAEVALDSRAEYRLITLKNPDRLVLDVLDTGLSPQVRLPAGGGVVSAVRSGKPEPGITRIVFDLAAPVVAIGPNLEWRDGHAVLILEWPGDGISAVVAHSQAAPRATPDQAGNAVSPLPAGTLTTVSAAPGTGTVPASPPAAATPAAEPAPMPSSPARLPQVVARPAVTPQPTRAEPAPPAATPAPVRSLSQMSSGALRPIVVAIDAGHGGQDPGAVGLNGTREKDITLAVARELARQVDAMPGLKAYLTRDADFFIPLAERYQRARRANADVFVSIHADAAENRNARGSSVYVLSTRGATSQAARWLADRENAADLVGGVRLKNRENTLASVLLDLSQSATQRASERIANEVLGGLRRVGKTHKSQIEKANFVVLRSPDVPSMLVETAFISNPEEEQRLKDPNFQRQLARAVLDGIHTHFTRMPPPGTHYAAWREAQGGGSSTTTASR
ncbi:N-acetylmuramoyl-L-alanine amidase [Luteimonas sp. e5]